MAGAGRYRVALNNHKLAELTGTTYDLTGLTSDDQLELPNKSTDSAADYAEIHASYFRAGEDMSATLDHIRANML